MANTDDASPGAAGMARSPYVQELLRHARPLFAATLGIGFGLSINNYTSSLFGAHLIKAFGWSREDFSLIGTFAVFMLLTLPLAGWVTDRIGVRKSALIGVVGMSLAYFGQAQLNGDIRVFFAINLIQMIFGSFVTSTVYNRVVAERFVTARGIAFAIIMSGPPLVGALAPLTLAPVFDNWGWRGGYQMLGVICLTFGLVAIQLLPKDQPRAASERPSIGKVFAVVRGSSAFWLLAGAMFLCNLPQALGSSQMMLMLMEKGAKLSDAWYLSVYPAGVVAGRFLTGAAMDRWPAQIVGSIGLALPAIGFALLSGPANSPAILGFAILLMGLAQGAEGDVAAYIVARRFPVAIFSTTVGLIGAATAFGASAGAALLRPMLAAWGSYTPFLIFSAVVTILSALLLLGITRARSEGPSGADIANPGVAGVD